MYKSCLPIVAISIQEIKKNTIITVKNLHDGNKRRFYRRRVLPRMLL